MRAILRKLIPGILLLLFSVTRVSAYYDPGAQRWLNRDPIGETGGVNLFRFAHNDPHGWEDAFGLDPMIDAFPSADAAAIDAACYLKKHPLNVGGESYEQAAAIFNQNSQYYYNYPQHGKSDIRGKSDPDLKTKRDDQDKLAGTIHNHIKGEDFSSAKDLPPGKKGDIETAKDLGVPSYLLTPKGDIKKFDPRTGKPPTKIGHCE
jgi:hypothetical protein